MTGPAGRDQSPSDPGAPAPQAAPDDVAPAFVDDEPPDAVALDEDVDLMPLDGLDAVPAPDIDYSSDGTSLPFDSIDDAATEPVIPALVLPSAPVIQLDGLAVRCSEVVVTHPSAVREARVDHLDDGRAQALLSGLPDLPTAPVRLPPELHTEGSPPPRDGAELRETLTSDAQRAILDVDLNPPLEVVRWSPVGPVEGTPEIRLVFSQPMVAEDPAKQAEASDPATIRPAVPGRWRWLGRRTALFEPSQAMTLGTRYRVTVSSGLRSADGGVLGSTKIFRFETRAPRLVRMWPPEGSIESRLPIIQVAFDQPVDANQAVSCIELLADAMPWPVQLIDVNRIEGDDGPPPEWTKGLPWGSWFAFRPRRALPFATQAHVRVKPGVRRRGGDVDGTREALLSFLVHDRLRVLGSGTVDPAAAPGTGFQIEFNNPLSETDFDESWVRTVPELRERRLTIDGATLLIEGRSIAGTWGLQVSPDLRDRFGHRLGRPLRLSFEIAPPLKVPALIVPGDGTVVLDPGSPLRLPVVARNQQRIRVELRSVEAADYASWKGFLDAFERWADGGRKGPRPEAPGRLVSAGWSGARGDANEPVRRAVDLEPAISEHRGHAVVLVEAADPPDKPLWRATWVQATELGMTLVEEDHQLTVRVDRLSDDEPAEGASVWAVEAGSGEEHGRARVDGDGFARLSLPRPGTELVVTVGDATSTALMPWTSAPTWRPRTRLRWHLVDPRDRWQPGEVLRMAGWVRTSEQGSDRTVRLSLPGPGEVQWSVRDGHGRLVAEGEAALSEQGGFSLDATLPPSAAAGSARVELRLRGVEALGRDRVRGAIAHHGFVLEAAEPLRFDVTAQSPPGPHVVGDRLQVTARASYLAGGVLPASPMTWSLWSKHVDFRPPGLDDWSFGLRAPWWLDDEEEAPAITHDVEAHTDAAGEHRLAVALRELEPPRPRLLLARATVSDVDGTSCAGDTRLLVMPSTCLVGLRARTTVVRPGEPLELEVLVCDVDGAIVSDREVAISLRQLWGEQLDGAEPPEPYRFYCAPEPEECELALPAPGAWSVEAEVTDSRGRSSRSQLPIWVLGGALPDGEDPDSTTLRLKPAEASHRAGEVAVVLVQAPFGPSEGMWTARSGGLVVTESFTLDGVSGSIEVPIQAEDVPGLEVEVLIRGLRPDDRGGQRPGWAGGSVTLAVEPVESRLDVVIEADAAVAEPGSEVGVAITVLDAAGQAVGGAEIALFGLRDRAGDPGTALDHPVDTFFARRRNQEVSFDHLRRALLPPFVALLARLHDRAIERNVIEEPDDRAVELGRSLAALADSASQAAPPPALPLAFVLPHLVTDDDGRLRVDIPLPEDAGPVRLVALAAAGADRFGLGRASIEARRSLLVEPSPPSFLRHGDRFELPVLVHNHSPDAMRVHLAVRGSGVELLQGHGRTVELASGQRASIPFAARVLNDGPVFLQVAARAGGRTDATHHEIPVLPPSPVQSFASWGSLLDDGRIVQPLAVPEAAQAPFGGLSVMATARAEHTLVDALAHLRDLPRTGTEQIASRILAGCVLQPAIGAAGWPDLPERAVVLADLTRDAILLAERQIQGGFPAWPGGAQPDPFATVHAAHALQRLAMSVGDRLPEEIQTTLRRALAWLRDLRGRLGDDWPPKVRWVARAYALRVRALAGEDVSEQVNRALKSPGPGGLSVDATALLIIAWSDLEGATSGDRGPVDEAIKHLESHAIVKAETATWPDRLGAGAWRVFAGRRRTEGLALSALLRGGGSRELADKVAAGLLRSRVDGHWGTSQEDIVVSLSLLNWLSADERRAPDFAARLWLGQDYAGSRRFDDDDAGPWTLELPLEHLPPRSTPGELLLAKDGPGELHFRFGLRWVVAGEDLTAEDHGFTLRRRLEGVDDPEDVCRRPDGAWHVRPGSRVRVTLELETGHARHHVALVDRIAAGFEPLAPGVVRGAGGDRSEPTEHWVAHRELRQDGVSAFSTELPPGLSTWSYLVRARTNGEFALPPARIEELYGSGSFGCSDAELVVIG